MIALLRFELAAYARRPRWYALLLGLLALGVFAGAKARLTPMPNVLQNSPYNITYFAGLLSLLALFFAGLLSAQHLFKERDHHFAALLYATPVRKLDHMGSRFLLVFGLSALYLGLIFVGFAVGQGLSPQDTSTLGPFRFWHYAQPFLLFILPNVLLCVALLCATAWLSRNKLLVYATALGLYIGYMVSLLFSGSPMLAGSFPATDAAMRVSALCDPFGISAFYQQTMHWSAPQRNGELVQLDGYFLLNRVGIVGISMLVLTWSYVRFRFRIEEATRKFTQTTKSQSAFYPRPSSEIIPRLDFGWRMYTQVLWSFLRLDLRAVRKGIAFWLILAGICFYLAMEIYSGIDRGVRLPAQYASTSLMVNTLVKNLPGMCLLVLLFYSHELVGRSRLHRFVQLEVATPTPDGLAGVAHWLALCVLVVWLLLVGIGLGILFQFLYGYPNIEWRLYLDLFYLAGLPLALSAALMVLVQSAIRQPVLGLAVASVLALLSGTGMGQMIGLVHPLFRFAAAYGGQHSEMNGWGAYWVAFTWRMGFGVALMSALVLGVAAVRRLKGHQTHGWRWLASSVAATLLSLGLGWAINAELDLPDPQAQRDWQAAYERRYRPFTEEPQAAITAVSTQVDLFPEQNSYEVKGHYTLQNQHATSLSELLVSIPTEIQLQTLTIPNAHIITQDSTFGQYRFALATPLPPDGCIELDFAFSYAWSPFVGHQSFNAITENGSFLRISNYFPRLGYQPDRELDDPAERKRQGLGAPTGLLAADAPRSPADDFIDLDMRISTSAGQTAIGIGELIASSQQGGRSHFHYRTVQSVRFRFAVASAAYAIKTTVQDGIPIAVFYHPAHPENVGRLLAQARRGLAYCQQHFGPFPFQSLRFVEISGFTQGFAGTAYPGSIFMPENVVFHNDLRGAAQQDVINELAGHELAHMWWGSQLVPDGRVGATFLTETLAMYTELMLAKAQDGPERVLDLVDMHRGIYLSERGFADEKPLWLTEPNLVHVHYSRGLISMYQLSMLIGEEKVNAALRQLLRRHAYPQPAPRAADLLTELYAVSDTALYGRIDDLFRRIVTYEFRLEAARLAADGAAHVLRLDLAAWRSVEDGRGHAVRGDFGDSLEVALVYAGGRRELRAVDIRGQQAQVVWRLAERPSRVELDPRRLWLQVGERVVQDID